MSPEYEACIRTIFYHKKGKKVENEFKAGDLVFELKGDRITVGKLTKRGEHSVRLEGGSTTYIPSGYALGNLYLGKLFHANPENRQALVTLYGEDAVPELPLRGSELTRELLKKQKYVICWVNTYSDEYARNASRMVHIATEVEDDGFTLSNGGFAEFAVPIDNNGNEITEIE